MPTSESKRVELTMPTPFYERLVKAAEDDGRTVAEAIREAIRVWLKQQAMAGRPQ